MTGSFVAAEPGPADGTAVWAADLILSGRELAACADCLSPGERARAARFHREVDRDRYVASHAALRLILGRGLGLPPRSLDFANEAGGKPGLDGTARGRLHLNLSHSGRCALVAVSTRAPVGVDVEALRPMPDALRVARGHFAPEEAAALARLPGHAVEACFFGLWTRKEAVVKALGLGLALPLNRFSLTLPPDPPALLHLPDDAPRAWTLRHLEPGGGTVGTVAILAADVPVVLRALPPGWPDLLA